MAAETQNGLTDSWQTYDVEAASQRYCLGSHAVFANCTITGNGDRSGAMWYAWHILPERIEYMPAGYGKTIREEILYEYAKLISRSAFGDQIT